MTIKIDKTYVRGVPCAPLAKLVMSPHEASRPVPLPSRLKG